MVVKHNLSKRTLPPKSCSNSSCNKFVFIRFDSQFSSLEQIPVVFDCLFFKHKILSQVKRKTNLKRVAIFRMLM